MVVNNNIPADSTDINIEDRLLDAAESLFCEKGFDGASIRDITSQANCNVAAVNYHFGGKENLYSGIFIDFLPFFFLLIHDLGKHHPQSRCFQDFLIL